MRTLTPVAVALFVVLAGCSGIPLPGSESDRVSVTPADVPTGDGSGTIAPGVTETGIVNAQTLVDAHRRVLVNEPMTMNSSVHAVAENGTVLHRVNSTVRYGANRTNVYTHSSRTAPGRTGSTEREGWSNDTDSYVLVRENSTTYHHRPGMNTTVSPVIMKSLKNVVDISVQNLSNSGGPDQYRLEGTSKGANEQSPEYQLTLRIDERGFIHEYRYEVQRQQRETTIRQTTNIHFHANTTPPERPEWVSKAVNATKNETTESSVEG